MTGRIVWALAVATTLGAGVASAQNATEAQPTTVDAQPLGSSAPQGPQGFELSLGVGFQGGVGYLFKNGESLTGPGVDAKLGDTATGAVPIQLEVGYRVSPKLFVGVYGSYGIVFPKRSDQFCPDGWDCKTAAYRVGPTVQYHFSPGPGLDPYLGLGFGFSMSDTKLEGDGAVSTPGGALPGRFKVAVKDRGPEFLNASFGVSWELGKMLRLGPVLTGTFGRYTVRNGTQEFTPTGAPQGSTAAIKHVEDGTYSLFILSIRGTLNP